MKLANTLTKLLAVVAVSAALLPAVPAQNAPAQPAQQKPAQQKPAHKAGHRAKAAKPGGMAPAPAPAAAPAAPAADQNAAPGGEAAPGGDKGEAVANKRDPFVALISEKKEGGGPDHLPPGKAGLVIASVRVDGTVQSPWFPTRSSMSTSSGKATVSTTAMWKRLAWMGSPLRKIRKTPSGSRLSAWLRSESTRVQESSNEDHVAGVGAVGAVCG